MLVKKKKKTGHKKYRWLEMYFHAYFFKYYFNLKKRSNASISPPQTGHPITKSTITFLSKDPCMPGQSREQI